MDSDSNLASLRATVSALVEEEGELLSQAVELSRSGNRRDVDILFAQVQTMQVRRNALTQQIGAILGTQRMHVASEVWKPGVYAYASEVGAAKQRVRVIHGALELQVLFTDQDDPIALNQLPGTFDGPLAVDDAATHRTPSPNGAAKAAGRTRARRSGGATPLRDSMR